MVDLSRSHTSPRSAGAEYLTPGREGMGGMSLAHVGLGRYLQESRYLSLDDERVSVTSDFGLAHLDPIGLDQVTAAADLQTRKDRKYLVPRYLVRDLIATAGRGARVLTIDGLRSFRYESVYFDTVDLASYLGAARRRPRRFKVRTRCYLDTGECQLEVKTRDTRGRSVKHREPYDIEARAELTRAGRRFVATIEQAAAVAGELQPILTTTYRRTTLVLAGTDARVTIDRDLAWRRPDGHRVEITGVALIETKTPGPPCTFDRALWRSGQRPVVISKYCTGLAALSPGLPANKWNRVLRRYFSSSPPPNS